MSDFLKGDLTRISGKPLKILVRAAESRATGDLVKKTFWRQLGMDRVVAFDLTDIDDAPEAAVIAAVWPPMPLEHPGAHSEEE